METLLKYHPEVDFRARVQNYKNVESHDEAMRHGASITELKYDGWWARAEIQNGKAKVFSRQNQLKHEMDVDMPNSVIIGEFLKGTQRVVSGGEGQANSLIGFDVLSWEGKTYADKPWYIRRRVINRFTQYGTSVVPVVSYGIDLADSLWRQHVENGTCEGLVYKRIGDTYIDSTVWRRKKEVTMDYIMMGVYEGAGKHKGRLGGINGGLWVNGKAEIRCKVGGGFNDAEREDIWNNPQKYMGRVLEVKGWQLFESGAVRHPNAVRDERTGQLRWRDDKEQKDCYWAE